MKHPAPTQVLRRQLLWRVHFWAALIASPFALLATLTGLLYAFNPQIEQVLYAHLDHVEPSGPRRSLDPLVLAATQAAPTDWTLHSVAPPQQAQDSLKVAFVPPGKDGAAAPSTSGHAHGNHPPATRAGQPAPARPFLRPNFGMPANATVVYVNPYTATVLGQLPQSQRFNVWARGLHSTLLQGQGWRWMIELAASWLLVMLLTGVVLWWPGQGRTGLPRTNAQGRAAWAQWHAFLGATLGLVSLVILSTGLTWSQYAGEQVKWARDATGQAPPRIPAHIHSTPQAKTPPLGWQAAWEAVRQQAPDVALQLMPPQGPHGTWRANHLNSTHPTRRFDMLLDAYSGERLYFSGWAEQTPFGQATAVGIPFHRGELGLWNQALLVLFGVGVAFSIVSGWVMYWQRRKRGQGGFPPLPVGAWRNASPAMWVGSAILLIALPLLALSACAVALLEGWWHLRRPHPAR